MEASDLKLYQLSAAVVSILEADEATPELLAQLDELLPAMENKVESLCGFIQHLEGQSAVLAERAKAFSDRARAAKNKAEGWKEYLHRNMEAINAQKIEAGVHVVTIRTNPERVEIDNEKEIPIGFFRPQEPVLDKTMLKDALKAGMHITGAHLEKGTRLEIK